MIYMYYIYIGTRALISLEEIALLAIRADQVYDVHTISHVAKNEFLYEVVPYLMSCYIAIYTYIYIYIILLLLFFKLLLLLYTTIIIIIISFIQ